MLLGVLAVAAVLALGAYGWYRYEYPYGRGHRGCCRFLLSSLLMYAGDHDDKFPSGGATPEASLCVLYREKYVDAGTLVGWTESPDAARRSVESGGVLAPDTCDWHYVEGVNHDADSTIAIFWSKSSIGHTGKNLHGGHQVGFNDGHVEVVRAERWEAFLAEQKELVARYVAEKSQKAEPALP
jgi:hypothetical protein